MNSQCLNRRLDSQPLIAAEVAAWEKEAESRESTHPLDLHPCRSPTKIAETLPVNRTGRESPKAT